VSRFDPSADEVEAAREKVKKLDQPKTFTVQLNASHFDASIVDELKSVFANFPGEAEVVLEMATSEGPRKLRFGAEFRVAPSAGLRAELNELLGGRPVAA
jgi:DNA polymerase-3 subunit alpha